MSLMLYVVIAAVVAVISLGIGVKLSVDESRGSPGDLAVLLAVSLIAAATAGAVWPATLLLGSIGGAVVGPRAWRDRKPIVVHLSDLETDVQKYRRMAREQRALANTHRKNSPDLAQLHEQTAAQYEGLARVYEKD